MASDERPDPADGAGSAGSAKRVPARHEVRHESPLGIVVRRPVAVSMFVLAMAVFGFVSLSKLKMDLLPEISYPALTVRTSWPGAAPEDVEERISEKVQEALSTLDDLVRSTSISRAGASDVVLDFDWGTPMTFAVQDVREKLDGVFLPAGVERPLILRYDPNLDPILRVGIRAPEGKEARDDAGRIDQLIQLRWLAENRIKRELESLEGVAAVLVRGGLEEEIRVRADPYQLAAKQIDPGELARRLAQENINASGGSLLEGSSEYLVRTVNQFRTLAEIESLPVATRGDAVIRVSDVATVERTYEKREVVSRIGGAESVEVAIYREAGANVVQLAQRVKEKLFGDAKQQEFAADLRSKDGGAGRAETVGERGMVDFLAWRYRKDLRMELLSDQSVFIQAAVEDVKNSAVVGAILAVCVIWLFLRKLAPTVIIGVSIPISVIVTFALMYMSGVSLNIMSLGGLALGVGMLVDNAIVVLESITRCRDEGDDAKTAAVRGASEVAGAVVASTLTTVAVFAPIVFVTGIAGQIFGDQALTVVSSLLVSLVVAIGFIPMLSSRRWTIGRPVSEVQRDRPPGLTAGLRWKDPESVLTSSGLLVGRLALVGLGGAVRLLALVLGGLVWVARMLLRPIAAGFQVLWDLLDRAYPRALGLALRNRILVVLAGAALFWVALERVPHLGVELLPEMHQGEFTAHAKLFVGSPLPNTDAVLTQLDEAVRRIPGVETTALTIGVEDETLTREIEGPHTARMMVRLTEDARTPEREEEITARVRELLSSHPAMRSVEISRPTPFALESPIAVEIRGYDLEKLEQVGRDVQERLEAMPELADVRSTVRPGFPEARVTFDREKMLDFGLDLAQVSNLVRDQVLGNVSTRFHEGDDRIAIRVMGDEAILNTLDAVLDLPVNPASPSPVALRSVASVETVQGPAEIRRIGNSRAVVISAAGRELDLGGLSDRIDAEIATIRTPDDVSVQLGGQKREMDEAQTGMFNALLLAIFLVYVVMATQFESLLQPLVILLAVPLAAVGVIFTLDWLDVPVSVVVFIGLILLAGIVVNNAIVLVDRINQKRAQGLDMDEAILDAGRARLRPILMTTMTTVLGLLPMTGWLELIPVPGWLPGLGVLERIGAGEGAEIRAPMAITVIAGLTSSTLLTLIYVPAVYSLVARRRVAPALGRTPVALES